MGLLASPPGHYKNRKKSLCAGATLTWWNMLSTSAMTVTGSFLNRVHEIGSLNKLAVKGTPWKDAEQSNRLLSIPRLFSFINPLITHPKTVLTA